MAHPPLDEQITFIYTTDMAASDAFYAGQLELPLALDQGSCHIYRLTAAGYLGVCQRPAETIQAVDPRKRGVIITLVTQEVDRWHQHLVAKGVRFESPPQFNAEYDIYHCFLRDPNGYLIEIQRFAEPRWAKR
jgi:catechol 2,3-dioxygenase-like lactoylglutathione lyase family enzyme